ncbi:hypothetical protein C1H69_21465, partial [Billgrantia endophytica]
AQPEQPKADAPKPAEKAEKPADAPKPEAQPEQPKADVPKPAGEEAPKDETPAQRRRRAHNDPREIRRREQETKAQDSQQG